MNKLLAEVEALIEELQYIEAILKTSSVIDREEGNRFRDRIRAIQARFDQIEAERAWISKSL